MSIIHVREPVGNPASESADRPADDIAQVYLGCAIRAFEFVINPVDVDAAISTDTPSRDTADADTEEPTRALRLQIKVKVKNQIRVYKPCLLGG